MTFLYFYFYFPWEERHNLLLWHCVCTLMMPTGLLSLFFCFISKTTSECHGGGTWFSWESPELLRAIFLFQSSPSASRLEGCFMSNAQLTRLRTVVGCSHFFLFIFVSHLLLTRENAVLQVVQRTWPAPQV